MRFVSWYNTNGMHASLAYRTPEQAEDEYYQKQAAQTVSQ
ncbi:integrase core domain protein [Bifidobacterium longum subsp. suis]|uniref:Integrase core domain protein n=1 Tax=Bifidobacterium longum subsp. suis TaxID=1695 RepID=A0A087BGJ3_BIFLN|nr:integrase core domain protein [Bifidobacterium longum subsp. suis]